MSSSNEVDFIVIGAGMAGASVAAHLAKHGRVAILEAEQHAGYHSTGRSAALFSQIYGNAVIRALSRASRSFLFDPPNGFSPSPLVRPRDTLYFASADQLDVLKRFRTDADVCAGTIELTADEAHARVPVFRPGYLAAAVIEQGSADIDVDALHQGFLRVARSRGAEVLMNGVVTRLDRVHGRWSAETARGTWSAPVVVNAAGAWGDAVAQLAGIAPVGLQPMRRTALLIETPAGLRSEDWPASIDIAEGFYFKPDAGLLLLSPADETPSPACDVQPEDIDVAIAVDRFEQATGTLVRQVKHRWAGLRVFSPDRSPVVGFDPDAQGFFWLAGQGGYGIQTAVALGRAAAALALHQPLPEDIAKAGVEPEMLSRARFDVRRVATRGLPVS
jgi:D-arginine dehydrogenase